MFHLLKPFLVFAVLSGVFLTAPDLVHARDRHSHYDRHFGPHHNHHRHHHHPRYYPPPIIPLPAPPPPALGAVCRYGQWACGMIDYYPVGIPCSCPGFNGWVTFQ